MDLESDEAGGGLLQALGVAAVRDAGRDRRRGSAAQPVQRASSRPTLGLGARGDPARAVRPRDRRRRPGGPGRGGLRRLRGARHAGDRRRRASAARRAPRRGSRTTSASRPASPAASWRSARRCRRASSARAWSCPPKRSGFARGGRPLRDPTRRRRDGQRAHRDRRHRRRLPPARRPRARALRGRRRLLRRHAERGADCAPATRS